jgi:signal transduction histidine kinase
LNRNRSFAARLTLAFALLLAGFGLVVALIGWKMQEGHDQEAMQRQSHGLARHIVERWPQVAPGRTEAGEREARDALLTMLKSVNPGIQVYVLDATGGIDAYIGEPGMVRQRTVDLEPVRRFLAGYALPLHGTDPMGSNLPRIFSAAAFPARAGETAPPGYLYIVLDGQHRDPLAQPLAAGRLWLGAGAAAAAGLAMTLLLGMFTFSRLTRPLRDLERRMRAYSARGASLPVSMGPNHPGRPTLHDEVAAIGEAFDQMTTRVEAQGARAHQQARAHREIMAGVAHDLRTPLTALHGHLEAMKQLDDAPPGIRDRLLGAALAQSDRVRRLSQQLFELVSLQAVDQILHRERFLLDELVVDAVQKFELIRHPAPILLAGPPPGRLELDADLQLVERALTNLIDNAIRHAPGGMPVRVTMTRTAHEAQVLIEDDGPGLPEDIGHRLNEGSSVRDPPVRRAGGGIGGLGLAIAQRVAILHGGRLQSLPPAGRGTRMCLALPLAA